MPTSHPRSAARKCSAGKPHSSIQVWPITRPSLRSGLTAYAVLSREPNSFWPPSLRELTDMVDPVGRSTPPRKLDRSDDGQDHTVLPYARFACSPHDLPALSTLPEECRRDELTAPLVDARLRAHRDYPPCPTSRAQRCPRPPHPRLAIMTTYDRPSRMSRDGRYIRHFRISVKWNIFRWRG